MSCFAVTVFHSRSPFQILFLCFCMKLRLIQPRSFSLQPHVTLPKDLLSSFSSRSLSHSFLSLSARCPGLNFLCTRTLPFQKQLWEQPKSQRETEHCTMTVSLNCIAPAQTDITCFGEKMHVCFPPCLYMHARRGQLLTVAKNEQHLSVNSMCACFTHPVMCCGMFIYLHTGISTSLCIPTGIWMALCSGRESGMRNAPTSPFLYQAIGTARPS